MAEVITVTQEVDINVYSVEDPDGNSATFSFKVDIDDDIIINIEEYLVDSDEYALLQRAKELTQEDWDIVATSNLIDPQ